MRDNNSDPPRPPLTRGVVHQPRLVAHRRFPARPDRNRPNQTEPTETVRPDTPGRTSVSPPVERRYRLLNRRGHSDSGSEAKDPRWQGVCASRGVSPIATAPPWWWPLQIWATGVPSDPGDHHGVVVDDSQASRSHSPIPSDDKRHSHRLLVPLTPRPGSDESRSRCPGLSLSHRLPTCGCGSLMACVVPVTAGSEWRSRAPLCVKRPEVRGVVGRPGCGGRWRCRCVV